MSGRNKRPVKKNVRISDGLVNDKKKKKSKLSIPTLISIFSLIIAISGIGITFWFNNKNYKKQYDEDLRITIYRNFENYNTRIIDGVNEKFILIQFNCLIVNNSEKPVVIERYESTSFDKLSKGYGLRYDSDSEASLELPIKIESRESKKFIIDQYMKMDTVAFSILKSSIIKTNKLPIKDVEYILAKKGVDIFGCKASFKSSNGQEIISYGNPGDLYNLQSFIAKFETTNNTFKMKYSYYFDPYEKW